MADAFVAAPRIDAYWRVDDAPFDVFERQMQSVAYEWGETAIGRFVLEGFDPPRFDDASYILAIGEWSGRRYAAVGDKALNIRVVEYDWPGEWDVT